MQYPYLTIRLMACAYQTLSVEDFKKRLGQCDASENLPLLIGRWVKCTGFQVCLVMNASACTFFESDGSTRFSDEPPSGGIEVEVI